MKHATLILSALIFLVAGVFIGQNYKTKSAYAADNDHDGIADTVDVVDDDNDGQLDEGNTDKDNNSVQDQDE